jgi:sugar lactone lactonase YvrE
MPTDNLLAVCLAFVCSIASADDIYVSVEDTSVLVKFDSNGNGTKLPTTGGVLFTPNQLAFDAAGNLYVADDAGSNIGLFDTQGKTSIFASTNIANAAGLAFDQHGNLFVANRAGNTIWKFDPNGNGTLFASANVNFPSNLAFDDDGNLYVANSGASTIIKFDPSGNYSPFASLSFPIGIAFRNGIIYATGALATEVFRFDLQGNLLPNMFSNPNVQGPAGLAFDSAGNLYVANNNGASIGKFDPQGVYTQFSITNFGAKPAGVVCRAASAPPPVLTVKLLSTNLVISWPSAVPGAELQQASDITSSNWVPVTNALSATNGQVLITLPKSTGGVFYRLRHL